MRVEDAKGQPPTIPFWLGEAPGRTEELSTAVSQLRAEHRGAADQGIEAATRLAAAGRGMQRPRPRSS